MKNLKTSLALLSLLALAVGGRRVGRPDSNFAPAETGHGSMAGMKMPIKSHSSGAASSKAVQLRITLNELLGEHAILAVQATQRGLVGGKKISPALAKALDKNSVAISQAIASVYGAAAGNQFLNGKNMWRAHITDFVDYTVALKKHDTAGQHKAVTALNAYITSFGSFLAKATGLPATAVQGDLREHVAQLKGQIDAYAQGRYTTSATLTDQAYMHMFMTGQILTQGIVNQPTSSRWATYRRRSWDCGSRWTSCSASTRCCPVSATQEGLDGSPDFPALAGQLDRRRRPVQGHRIATAPRPATSSSTARTCGATTSRTSSTTPSHSRSTTPPAREGRQRP